MAKIVVKCRSCKKKMKIQDKKAKYRCPNCKKIYNYNGIRKFNNKVVGVVVGFFQTLKDMKNNIVYKFKSIKNTYTYMRNVKKNTGSYHNQRTEKKVNPKGSFFNNIKDKFKRK